MQKGSLRQDLFYRMDIINLLIPPLRKRPKDVEYLAKFFLKKHSAQMGRQISLDPQTIKVLKKHHRPGNIRELKSVIGKAVLFAKSAVIKPDDLPSHILANRKSAQKLPKTLEEMEREHILTVLEEMSGNQSKTAAILGINRKTLYKKIHKHKIF